MSTYRTLILGAVALLALIFPVLGQGEPAAAPSSRSTPPVVAAPTPAAVVHISGDIDDFVRDQTQLRIERAKAAGAKTIILQIDTYGGLVTSGLDISRFLKNQSDLRIIAFVNSKAISAGAMIALACDEIYMTPSATFGDCAPIRVDPSGGAVSMEPTERSKAESPVLSDFQESAQHHGYPPLLAVAMVSIPYTVYWIENATGEQKFVDAAEYKSLTESGDWKPVAGVANPIDGPETLLTVHTEQALKYGLARGTATTADDLALQAGLTIIERYENGAGTRVVSILSSPITRIVLMVIFINALMIAFKTPGTGGAEAIALISLGTLVGVPLLTGYAEWAEILMILAGVALIAFEIFVFPGVFLGLILGGLLLLGGLMLTFVGDVWQIPDGWSMPKNWDALQTGIQVTVIGLACSMLLFAWLRTYLPKLPYFNRLVLTATSDGPARSPDAVDGEGGGGAGASADRWPFVGTVGTAVSDLKPGGTARFPYADDSRITSVVSVNGYVHAGTKLVVCEVHGNHVVVKVAS